MLLVRFFLIFQHQGGMRCSCMTGGQRKSQVQSHCLSHSSIIQLTLKNARLQNTRTHAYTIAHRLQFSNFQITIVKISNNLQSFCSFHCYHIMHRRNVDFTFYRFFVLDCAAPRAKRPARATQSKLHWEREPDVPEGKSSMFLLLLLLLKEKVQTHNRRLIRNVNRNGRMWPDAYARVSMRSPFMSIFMSFSILIQCFWCELHGVS